MCLWLDATVAVVDVQLEVVYLTVSNVSAKNIEEKTTLA